MTPPMTDPVALGRTAFYATVSEFARLWFEELSQQADDPTAREVGATLGDAADRLTVRPRPSLWGGAGAEPAGAERVYRLLARFLPAVEERVGEARAEPEPAREEVPAEPAAVAPRPEEAAESGANGRAKLTPRPHRLTCSLAKCGREFRATIGQKKRHDGGLPVYCSISHAQTARWDRRSVPLPTMAEMVAEEEAEAAAV